MNGEKGGDTGINPCHFHGRHTCCHEACALANKNLLTIYERGSISGCEWRTHWAAVSLNRTSSQLQSGKFWYELIWKFCFLIIPIDLLTRSRMKNSKILLLHCISLDFPPFNTWISQNKSSANNTNASRIMIIQWVRLLFPWISEHAISHWSLPMWAAHSNRKSFLTIGLSCFIHQNPIPNPIPTSIPNLKSQISNPKSQIQFQTPTTCWWSKEIYCGFVLSITAHTICLYMEFPIIYWFLR